MIKNKRQLKVALRKREGLTLARENVSDLEANVLEKLRRELDCEIEEFREISEGRVTAFNFQSLDDLGEILSKVRISRGLTQAELADRLGVSEQMVQRDEAGDYEGAGLARVADAFDALEYLVRGSVCPVDAEPAYFNFHTSGVDESLDDFAFSSSLVADTISYFSSGPVDVRLPQEERRSSSDTSSVPARLAEVVR